MVAAWRGDGFINISQNARTVVFLGTFTAGGLRVAIEDGQVRIEQEGRQRKLVREVEHRTFGGSQAMRSGQRVLYVTERCVFTLTPAGLRLDEIAPGIDLQRDVLGGWTSVPWSRTTPCRWTRAASGPRPWTCASTSWPGRSTSAWC